jgi:ribosomal protein L29
MKTKLVTISEKELDRLRRSLRRAQLSLRVIKATSAGALRDGRAR